MAKQRLIKTLLQQRLNNSELRAQFPKKDWKREKQQERSASLALQKRHLGDRNQYAENRKGF